MIYANIFSIFWKWPIFFRLEHGFQEMCMWISVFKKSQSFMKDDEEYSCRIWALNSVSIHKALVPNHLCSAEILAEQVQSNFNDNFDNLGLIPPAEAYCCNWTYCNYNVTFAQMTSDPNYDLNLKTSAFLVFITIAMLMIFTICILLAVCLFKYGKR